MTPLTVVPNHPERRRNTRLRSVLDSLDVESRGIVLAALCSTGDSGFSRKVGNYTESTVSCEVCGAKLSESELEMIRARGSIFFPHGNHGGRISRTLGDRRVRERRGIYDQMADAVFGGGEDAS